MRILLAHILPQGGGGPPAERRGRRGGGLPEARANGTRAIGGWRGPAGGAGQQRTILERSTADRGTGMLSGALRPERWLLPKVRARSAGPRSGNQHKAGCVAARATNTGETYPAAAHAASAARASNKKSTRCTCECTAARYWLTAAGACDAPVSSGKAIGGSPGRVVGSTALRQPPVMKHCLLLTPRRE